MLTFAFLSLPLLRKTDVKTRKQTEKRETKRKQETVFYVFLRVSSANIGKFKLLLNTLILSVFTFICFLVFSNTFRRTKIFLTSKYEMLGAGCYWLSEEPLIGGTVSWGTTRARHCNYLRLRDKKTGEEFRIIDTHLDHKSDNARREQARMLAEEAGQYADDFPQIICGDFNSSISDGAAQTLHVAGWKDAYEWMGFPDRFSFHGFKGEKYTKKNTRIDFIYLHGKVKPVHCRMITEGVNGILPSDHYFVMADVKVGD